jgi:hypothetical protein
MYTKDDGTRDLELFLREAPTPMYHALKWLTEASDGEWDECNECAEALKKTLRVIMKVERETDAEKTNALLIEMAVEVARLRELLGDVGYTKSEAWAVVEEMQRFAKADAK